MYAGDDYRYGLTPNAWVVSSEARLPRGARVLSIGDGEGRNGVWLAERGHHVTTIDASARGAEKARALAAQRGVDIDARSGHFPDDIDDTGFDAVVMIYVHTTPDTRAALHAAAVQRLERGGAIILEAFTPEQLAFSSGGPRNPAMLYTAEQIASDFAHLEVDALEACQVELDEGPGHRGPAAVVRAFARRADG